MGLFDRFRPKVGRPKHEPQRDSSLYPRLLNMGSNAYQRDRPLIKPTPANLRRFARTTYARRAINVIKNPIASLQWEIVPKPGFDESPELNRQIDIVTACFQQPNTDDSFRALVEVTVEDMLVGGAGSVETQLGGDATRPLWMWPVDVLSIQIYPAWSGADSEARYFQSLGYGNVSGITGKQLRNDELLYIKLDPNNEQPFGVGPLEIAFNSVNRLVGTQEYAGNVASNAQPEIGLQFPNADDNFVASMRTYWRNEVEGQGNIPMFGGGEQDINVLKLRGANDDALYLAYQELLVREIAAAFGISPQNLSIERDVNRDTSEAAEDRDWDLTIRPLAGLIASNLNRRVIEAKLGFSQIEFRWVGLDREDEEANAKIYQIQYQNNMITPDEQRARLGMTPMEGVWGSMTNADVEIAIQAARSAAVIEDPDLPKETPAAPKGGKKGK